MSNRQVTSVHLILFDASPFRAPIQKAKTQAIAVALLKELIDFLSAGKYPSKAIPKEEQTHQALKYAVNKRWSGDVPERQQVLSLLFDCKN